VLLAVVVVVRGVDILHLRIIIIVIVVVGGVRG